MCKAIGRALVRSNFVGVVVTDTQVVVAEIHQGPGLYEIEVQMQQNDLVGGIAVGTGESGYVRIDGVDQFQLQATLYGMKEVWRYRVEQNVEIRVASMSAGAFFALVRLQKLDDNEAGCE